MPDSTSPAPLPAPEANAGANSNASSAVTPGAASASQTPAAPNAAASSASPASRILAASAPEEKRRSPSALNQRQIAELDETEQICLAAQKPAYAPVLASRKISPAVVAALLAAVLAARRKSNLAVVCSKSTESAAVAVDTTEETLVRTLRQAQAAAKQEHAFTDKTRLGAYFVGERIDQSRATLEQCGQGIIDKTSEERPGGVDTAFINRVSEEFEAWKTARAQPASRRSQAKTERAARNGMVAAIRQGRVQIQLAADQSWPPGVPANAGVRGEFHLQPNRPLTLPTRP